MAKLITLYRGDAKTLLAFDLTKRDTARLAGFTVEVRLPGGESYYLFNSLTFEHPGRHAQDAAQPSNSSLNAPLHKFRWVHVPGTFHQGLQPEFGEYTYVVTPRYFDGSRSLLPLDAAKSEAQKVEVAPFKSGSVELGFTRGFVQSQGFVNRFGPTAQIRPDGDELLFDTSVVAGANARGTQYTYAEQYEWLGFTARNQIFGVLEEVAANGALQLDVFAYDLDEPDIARALLALAAEGRVRIILDDAALHHSKPPKLPKPEDVFETQFKARATGAAEIKRGHFGSYAHDKVMVVRNGNRAIKVLTGATNFSVTGLYVNSNHVVVLDDRAVAGTYAQLFQQVWDQDVKRAAFMRSPLANQPTAVPGVGEITFAPHTDGVAAAILGGIVQRIEDERRRGGSVLFAVMSIDKGSESPVWAALREIHKDPGVFSFGISDSPAGIQLYEPKRKNGVVVTGRPGRSRLPPPFNQVPSIGGGHQIHHKFVVCGFKGQDPVVYCGSSNLASGGEEQNGDNLLEIHDPDVVTAYAIEAVALVDHFQFLNRLGNGAPAASRTSAAADAGWFLSTSDGWAGKYYDSADLYETDRKLFGG